MVVLDSLRPVLPRPPLLLLPEGCQEKNQKMNNLSIEVHSVQYLGNLKNYLLSV